MIDAIDECPVYDLHYEGKSEQYLAEKPGLEHASVWSVNDFAKTE